MNFRPHLRGLVVATLAVAISAGFTAVSAHAAKPPRGKPTSAMSAGMSAGMSADTYGGTSAYRGALILHVST